jgi:hypothetical protein
MDYDAIGTSHFNQGCSRYRIRVFHSPRLAKGGHMIDINS